MRMRRFTVREFAAAALLCVLAMVGAAWRTLEDTLRAWETHKEN